MNTKSDPTKIELWAGFEHTINRVQNRYVDQLAKMGLAERLPDFSLLKDLGLKKLRCPFLWESIADHADPKKLNWSYCEKFLKGLSEVGIKPIAGFLHHGSGPAFTNLLDPAFPQKFAAFAIEFCKRFPEVQDFTPINEPLTTARFSALYGHWYPHKKDDRSFVLALYHQIKAIILAMQAVRIQNAGAQFIQTEDMGRTQASPRLQYQAEFENERRWLSFDLLTGRVNHTHPLYDYLTSNGLSEAQLSWLSENALPPDVIGLNHYLLSNRYLEEDIAKYPSHVVGGNGLDEYVDIAAADTGEISVPSPDQILCEAWNRYQIPLAITEVHLRGYREDQMRWLYEIKKSCEKVSESNIPVKAIGVWSLFGAMDWNSLCTKDNYFYESGFFDLRSDKPRKTALVSLLKNLNESTQNIHAVLQQPGWWRKPEVTVKNRPLLVTGANGTLGRAILRICKTRNIFCLGLSRNDLDITYKLKVQSKLKELKPWAVINAAGYVRVDQAETEWHNCIAANILGPKNLAEVCALEDIQFLNFSSDLVFSGEQNKPYTEDQPVNPLNTYGKSKAASEKEILSLNPESLIARTSSFFSPWDKYNFIFQALSTIAQNKHFSAASDITISPTYVPDLVNVCLDLLLDRERGIIHLVNEGALTWSDFARKAIAFGKKNDLALNARFLKALTCDEMNFKAKRPAYSALTSKRIRIMSHHDEALDRFFNETKLFSGVQEYL